MKKLTLAGALMLATISALAWDAPTMGWSSWNAYRNNINEEIIKSAADMMVSSGLKDAGYVYINIDDGAFSGRDENGKLRIHPTRFPNGMKAVTDYIVSLGLIPGTYSDAGHDTCASFWDGDAEGRGTGLYEHDQQDIDFLFKELGFRFIKVDFCGGDGPQNAEGLSLSEQERYTAISNAIKATGIEGARFNVCRWAYPGTWVQNVATSWRISQDIYLGWESVKDIIGQTIYLSAYATEGRFNDMDMLEVGRGLTEEEDKTHFGMWCILSSPLLVGADMSKIDDKAIKLMANEELIAVNQDPLALQAYVVDYNDGAYTLVKDFGKLYGTTRVIAFYNPTEQSREMEIDFFDVNLGGDVKVRDLYEKKDVGTFTGYFSSTVPAHGTRIYRLDAEKRYERHLYEAETGWITAYQELANNQAVETGIYEANAALSGGAKAGWLGKREDNDLQWRNVHSTEGGDYTMTLAFISGADRKFNVEVNGSLVTELNGNSGGWDVVKTIDIPVTLKSGNNIVRLYTSGDWMPDIDYMTVVKAGSLDVYKHELDKAVRNAQLLLDSDIPASLAEYLSKIVNDNSGEKTSKEGYLSAAEAINAAIKDVKKSVEVYEADMAFVKNCKENVANSVDNAAKTAFISAIENYEKGVDKAITSVDFQTLGNQLRDEAKSFFKSSEAELLPGKTWDVTVLIENPAFDADSHGWSGSPAWGSGVAEYWNRTFDTGQTLTGLKNGYYTVKVNALYRMGRNDSGSAYRSGLETIPAFFIANDNKVAVKSLYCHPVSATPELADKGLSGTHVLNNYVNSMFGASTAFGLGLYPNELETIVEDGKLRIGLRASSMKDDCWCCFDNFRLVYSGTSPAGVGEIAADADNRYTIYTLGGVILFNKAPKDVLTKLSAGIYIINGKKVLIK